MSEIPEMDIEHTRIDGRECVIWHNRDEVLRAMAKSEDELTALRKEKERLESRIAQLEAERDVMQEVVEAVKPISEACWDSEHSEWTFSDHDVIKLREKYAALSEQEEEDGSS